MKKIFFLLLILFCISMGCEKDTPIRTTTTPTPPPPVVTPPPPTVSTPFTAYAGSDKGVPLPATSLTVYGGATYSTNYSNSYSWKQISGPSASIIRTPNSHSTKIDSLQEGTYEFELTAVSPIGTDTDTLSVFVYNPKTPGANEYIFKYLEWSCPWGCGVYIENFDLYIPSGTPIKVFLKKNPSANWITVTPNWIDEYSYEIYNNNLSIYTNDAEGTIDVRVTF